MSSFIFGLVGLITGCLGAIISILSYHHNQIDALNNYFSFDRNTDFIKGRKIIYSLNGEIKEDDEPYISLVANTYHHWGLLVKHRQLPFWIFYDKKEGITASGIAILRSYKKIEGYIKDKQKGNRKYASYYKWLYDKIYNNCNEEEKNYINTLQNK